MIQFDFTNKTILITGGSRGIGKAIALLFAEAGGNVIITYRSNKAEADKTIDELRLGRHSSYQLDVANAEEIKDTVENILEKYDRLDVLVNNAGVFVEHSIDKFNFDEWQKAWRLTMETNLTGAANLTYLISQKMMQQRYGKIVNISSRGAFRGEPDHPAYAASKAGLNAMSQSLAVKLAPYNISIGIIAPGFVETDMTGSYLSGKSGDDIRNQSPFNRVATPEEVARLTAIFASDGLEFTSGTVVDINGASYLRT
jgi:NAD(P)-dependent dehydrogenase (short-subunit alcohol dehydrogenase family)